MCDDCFLKCNQWQSFKEQCECSEQGLRELSIKQVKSAINEIEFLDLGLEIKEEESEQENDFDNSFIPELDDQSNSSLEEDKPLLEYVKQNQLSSSEDDKPLSKRISNLLPSSICEVKMEKIQIKKSKLTDEILEPVKLLVSKANKNDYRDSFCISHAPISNHMPTAEKYSVCESSEVQWDKDDDYTPGGRSKSFVAYRCKDCNQVFRGLNVYELHFMEVHMNKEAIYCRICNEKYSRKLFLIQHLTRSHIVSIQTPTFFCEDCDVGFEKDRQLKEHKKAHLIFKCVECDITFSSVSQLNRHNRSHQRFYCDQCNKCFNRKFSLKVSYIFGLLLQKSH